MVTSKQQNRAANMKALGYAMGWDGNSRAREDGGILPLHDNLSSRDREPIPATPLILFGLYSNCEQTEIITLPIKIKFDMPLAGFAAQTALPGQEMLVETFGFHTASEGEPFLTILEGLTRDILSSLPVSPSMIDHLLVVVDRDGGMTIFVNELQLSLTIQSQNPKQFGELVFVSDIADINSVSLGVDIPTDCGFFFLFSSGWRKGAFFDFLPLTPQGIARDYVVGPSVNTQKRPYVVT